MEPLREGTPGAPPELESGPELDALDELIDSVSEDRRAPMLDWTSLKTSVELAGLLPGRTLFRPVEPDAGTLPYLDQTIDVVLTDETARMDEAARVASGAAVLVTIDEAGGSIAMETRVVHSKRRAAAASILVLVATEAEDEWLERFAEAVSARPGVDVEAAVQPLTALAATDAPTIVLAERGVLPLPGCIEAAESLLATNPRVGGVAVKLFDADGSLEAAGGAAFADGSVECIARGAPATAPWHEYVRPVAAAVGLVVLRSAAARQCCDDGVGALDLAALSAGLWSSGWELRYQPDAAAVRTLSPARAATTVWPQRADGLPRRPAQLDHATWRLLLARAEVGAAR
jgi:hypothetical protein